MEVHEDRLTLLLNYWKDRCTHCPPVTPPHLPFSRAWLLRERSRHPRVRNLRLTAFYARPPGLTELQTDAMRPAAAWPENKEEADEPLPSDDPSVVAVTLLEQSFEDHKAEWLQQKLRHSTFLLLLF